MTYEEKRAHLDWKKKCKATTCEDCDCHIEVCRCDCVPTIADLVKMIRTLAGISLGRTKSKPIHDDEKSSGPIGYRACGVNSWDNSVRAWDEDR